MSFYDDYVADGLCCQCCGAYIGDEPGYPQFCYGCKPKPEKTRKPTAKKRRGA
jgi:hypothetical protein